MKFWLLTNISKAQHQPNNFPDEYSVRLLPKNELSAKDLLLFP